MEEMEAVEAVRLAALNEIAAQAVDVTLPSTTANPTSSARSGKIRITDRLPVSDMFVS
jgi:hypothetical protein